MSNLTDPFPAPKGLSSWREFYINHLKDRVRLITDSIRQSNNHLKEIKPHLSSVITLLNQSQVFDEMSSEVIELIETIHPWPLRWGEWEAWGRQLDFALNTSRKLRLPDKEAFWGAEIANYFVQLGQMDEAIQFAKQALFLANSLRLITPLATAGNTLILAYQVRGEQKRVDQTLKLVKTKLENWRSHTSEKEWITAQLKFLPAAVVVLRQKMEIQYALQITSSLLSTMQKCELDSPSNIAEILRLRGTLLWMQQDYVASIRDFETAIFLLEQIDDLVNAAAARGEMGVVQWNMGDYSLSKVNFQHRVRILEQQNARLELVRAIGDMAIVYLAQKDSLALDYINEQLRQARMINDEAEISRALGNRGSFYTYLTRQFDLALMDLEQSMQYFREQQKFAAMAATQFDFSVCYSQLQKPDLAENALIAAETLIQQHDLNWLQIIQDRCTAFVRPDKNAVNRLVTALELSRQTGHRLNEAGCLFQLVSLVSDQREQQRLWQEGTTLLTQIQAERWLIGADVKNPPFIIPFM